MNESQRPIVDSRRTIVYALLAIVILGALSWYYGIRSDTRAEPNSNSLMVILPYRYGGTWVFDDKSVGLEREPFVAGVPEMIDALVADIPEAEQGFRLTFSASEFPGFQKKLTWTRSDGTGNYYRLDDPPLEGWICPALFQYYTSPPKELYVHAERTH